MTTLASAITAAQPREKAGARTSARFAFQVHVSLDKLLDLHNAGVDYLALFDHFDDLTIISGASDLIGLNFYQIKGRESKPWKATDLCRASGDAPRTTIGKMYYHTVPFSGRVKAAVFLTNAPFDFALAAGGRSTPDHMVLVFPDLAPAEHVTFAKALEPDFPTPRTPFEGDIIRFERTQVPLVGYDTFLKGRLVELFSDLPGAAIAPLWRTLVAEITTKSNDTTMCANFKDLYSQKGLRRDDIERVLSEAGKHRDILGYWDSLDAEMRQAGRSLPARIKVKTAITNYLRNRSKRVPGISMLCNALREAAVISVYRLSGAETVCEAAGLLESWLDPNLKAAYDGATLEAAFLVEAFDALNAQ